MARCVLVEGVVWNAEGARQPFRGYDLDRRRNISPVIAQRVRLPHRNDDGTIYIGISTLTPPQGMSDYTVSLPAVQ